MFGVCSRAEAGYRPTTASKNGDVPTDFFGFFGSIRLDYGLRYSTQWFWPRCDIEGGHLRRTGFGGRVLTPVRYKVCPDGPGENERASQG